MLDHRRSPRRVCARRLRDNGVSRAGTSGGLEGGPRRYGLVMRISEHSRSRSLADHPMWALDGETILRTFVFSGFPEAWQNTKEAILIELAATFDAIAQASAP